MKKLLCIAVAAGIGLSAHAFADRLQTELIKPIEPAVITDPDKVELGKKLWFEPRLSMSGSVRPSAIPSTALTIVLNLAVCFSTRSKMNKSATAMTGIRKIKAPPPYI